MSGLDEGRLLAYLDGELDAAERADVEAWVEESAEARDALDEARRGRSLVARAVAVLDPPVPDAAPVRARAEAEARRRAARTAPAGWGRGRLARAAVVVLLVGAAGASAAVPGSPVRAWLASVLSGDTPASSTAESGTAAGADAAAPAAPAEPSTDMGVRVRPADGRLEIELSGVPADREVVVRLVDAERGAVYARRASFRSGAGRIDAAVSADDAGPVRVEIPRSASVVSLRVDGRLWLEKRGERLDFPGPVARVSADTIRFGGEGADR